MEYLKIGNAGYIKDIYYSTTKEFETHGFKAILRPINGDMYVCGDLALSRKDDGCFIVKAGESFEACGTVYLRGFSDDDLLSVNYILMDLI